MEIELCLLKGMRGETGAARGVFGEVGWRGEGGGKEGERRGEEEGRWRGGLGEKDGGSSWGVGLGLGWGWGG